MSDGIETIRTAEAGSVAVRKTVETGDDDTATVTLEVTADRAEPVTVRLAEPGLADVPTDDVDLNGDYGAEHWRLDDGAVFERRFDGGESCTVVYRVRDVDEERFRRIDADPEIEVEVGADAPEDLDRVVDRAGSDAVRRVIEGRAESLTTDEGRAVSSSIEEGRADYGSVDGKRVTDAAGPPTGDGDGRPGDEASTVESDEGAASAGSAAHGTSTAESDGVGGSSDGIARALLAELRAGAVNDAVARELREELRVGKSQDVRIAHLQRQVADLAAYADVLETFIDEHGALDEAFGDLLADVEGAHREVAAVGDDLEALSERATAEVDGLADDVAALEDGQDAVRDRIGTVEGGLETVEGELEDVEERLDAVEAFANRLSGAFDRVDEHGDH